MNLRTSHNDISNHALAWDRFLGSQNSSYWTDSLRRVSPFLLQLSTNCVRLKRIFLLQCINDQGDHTGSTPGTLPKGFMMGFLPSNVAHLAIVKEQSRESKDNQREEAQWSERGGRITALILSGCGSTLFVTRVENRDSRSESLVAIESRKTERRGLETGCSAFNHYRPPLFLFPNTSIKQFLKVPAMSTLTTGDLDELYDNIVRLYTNCVRLKRVVTPVVPRPGISTAGEVLSGEEARMRNV